MPPETTVTSTFYFETKKQRKQFDNNLGQLGFEVEIHERTNTDNDYPFAFEIRYRYSDDADHELKHTALETIRLRVTGFIE